MNKSQRGPVVPGRRRGQAPLRARLTPSQMDVRSEKIEVRVAVRHARELEARRAERRAKKEKS